MKIYKLLKKGSLFCFCLFFSVSAFADGEKSGSTDLDFYTFIKRILEEDLQPLLGMSTTVSYFIGLSLIIAGMTRLYRHGSGTQNMMHRASPMATAMYFVAGIVLVSFMPHMQILSQSIFNDTQQVFTYQCNGQGPSGYLNADFITNSNDFCPMIAYSSHIIDTGEKKDNIGNALKYLMFGVLFLVGAISFIRGVVQLIKIGEGGGQGHGVGRALTHIIAGVVAVNGDAFYSLMTNIFDQNTRS